MFLVKDTHAARTVMIRAAVKKDPVVGLVLSVIAFEWCLRRTILALGTSPTKEIRAIHLNGPEQFKKVWKKEVLPRTGSSLAEVINKWDALVRKAYPLRHQIVHGIKPSVSPNHALTCSGYFLDAASDLNLFVIANGKSIYGGPIRRNRPWTPKVTSRNG